MNFLRRVYDSVMPSRRNALRPYLLRRGALLFFLALVLTAEGVFLGSVFAQQTARNFLAAVLAPEVVALTNAHRQANQVGTLTENPLLAEAAQAKAQDMAKYGYFSHNGPDGKEPWEWVKEAGYAYTAAGENLAVRFSESADVVEAWMNSPGHRANIVKSAYIEIGVGVAQGVYQGTPATFVVQYFGKPSVVQAQALAAPTVSADVAAPQVPAEPAGQVAVLSESSASPESQKTPVSSAPILAPTLSESVARNIAELGGEPSRSAALVLVGVVAVLGAVVFAAFAAHVQVQPTDMLMGGAAVAFLALAFLAANTAALPRLLTTSQTASVFNAGEPQVFIGESGAFTEVLGL